MIEIDGTALHQWDVGRRVVVTGIEVEHVHFANQGDSKAVIMGAVDIHAQIPDFLLQSGKQLCVYAVKDGVTVESKTFYVKKRERPENYVYEDDQRNYIYELITNAEEAIESMWWAYQDTNIATEKANLATENANASAASANQAAGSANLAAENANEAAIKAAQTADEAAMEATQIASEAAMEATRTANEAAAEATHIANEAAAKAAHTAKSLMVIGKDSGASIHLDDAIDQYLVGLRIFGKTTQDGTPTPDAPVDLVSVENPTVTVNDQTLLMPYTLHGIPVTSGGNYTDANGQQWVCDEIDFVNGVYVQRLISRNFDGTENWRLTERDETIDKVGVFYVSMDGTIAGASALCNRYQMATVNCASLASVGRFDTRYSQFRVNATNYETTLESWRQLLGEWNAQESPLNGVFALASPIETPLSEEELAAFAALRTYRGSTTVSNDASAHMEIEYVMDAKKYIDSMIHPSARIANVSLPASKWVGSGSLYSQVVYIAGITENSQVNLNPSVEQLSIFYEKDISFTTVNEGGVVTVYVIGQKPQNDYTIPADIVEVIE